MRATIAIAVAPLLVSCHSYASKYEDADHLYWTGRPRELIEAYAESESDRGRDALVGKMKLLSALILDRDWVGAEALALDVSTDVNVFVAGRSGERDALSTFGTERSKPFKGEPHEQAMADFYLGLLRYRRDDFEGALACFRSALAKDRGTYLIPVEPDRARDGDRNVDRWLYESDFAICEFFAAKCWARLGYEREANEALDRAREIRPELAPLFDRGISASNNVLIVIESGRAPRKVEAGRDGAVLGYRPVPELIVDDVVLSGTPIAFGKADDLYQEATTLGKRRIDDLNELKASRQRALEAVGKTAAVAGAVLAISGRRNRGLRTAGLIGVGAGLATLLVSASIDARADTRAWTTLPGSIVLAVACAEPASDHRLAVRIRGAGGSETRTWDGVELAAEENLIWLRLFDTRTSDRYDLPPQPRRRNW